MTLYFRDRCGAASLCYRKHAEITDLMSGMLCTKPKQGLVSSVGRAPVCRTGGRRSKPRPDQHSGGVDPGAQPLRVVGLGWDGTSHGTWVPFMHIPYGQAWSRKAGKSNVLHSIVFFVLDKKDPKTPRAPSWKTKFMSAAKETALEGKNKTFYCLAAGR